MKLPKPARLSMVLLVLVLLVAATVTNVVVWSDTNQPERWLPPTLSRCAETPRPRPTAAPSNPLQVDTTREDSPRLNADQQRVLYGATVQVLAASDTNGGWRASGFLTRNSKGDLVAVTAGHALIDYVSLDEVVVKDSAGRTSAVTKGCLIYESTRGSEPRPPFPLPSEIGHDVAAL